MCQLIGLLVLFLHVLAALWLAAGAFAARSCAPQTRRAPELAEQGPALRIGWRLVTVCAIPGSVVAGLTRRLLVMPARLGFKPGWVHASLGLWVLLLGVGLFYSAPRLKRTARGRRGLARRRRADRRVQAARRRQGCPASSPTSRRSWCLVVLMVLMAVEAVLTAQGAKSARCHSASPGIRLLELGAPHRLTLVDPAIEPAGDTVPALVDPDRVGAAHNCAWYQRSVLERQVAAVVAEPPGPRPAVRRPPSRSNSATISSMRPGSTRSQVSAPGAGRAGRSPRAARPRGRWTA